MLCGVQCLIFCLSFISLRFQSFIIFCQLADLCLSFGLSIVHSLHRFSHDGFKYICFRDFLTVYIILITNLLAFAVSKIQSDLIAVLYNRNAIVVIMLLTVAHNNFLSLHIHKPITITGFTPAVSVLDFSQSVMNLTHELIQIQCKLSVWFSRSRLWSGFWFHYFWIFICSDTIVIHWLILLCIQI